jgi:hypothetical protein
MNVSSKFDGDKEATLTCATDYVYIRICMIELFTPRLNTILFRDGGAKSHCGVMTSQRILIRLAFS